MRSALKARISPSLNGARSGGFRAAQAVGASQVEVGNLDRHRPQCRFDENVIGGVFLLSVAMLGRAGFADRFCSSVADVTGPGYSAVRGEERFELDRAQQTAATKEGDDDD